MGSNWGCYPPYEVEKNSRPYALSFGVSLTTGVLYLDLSPMSVENRSLHTALTWRLNVGYTANI